jgi:hypothetical protein
MKRVAVALLTVRGPHYLTLQETAIKGLFAACRKGEGAFNVLLSVIRSLAQASVQQIILSQQLSQSQASQAATSTQRASIQATADPRLSHGNQDEASTAPSIPAARECDQSPGCGPVQEMSDAMCCDSEGPVPDSNRQPADQPLGPAEGEEELNAVCATQRDSRGDAVVGTEGQQQVHNACCTLAHHFAMFGSLALCQRAFIEYRMEVAQRVAESIPSKKTPNHTDHAMAGVFHCADISDNEDDLQVELLTALRVGTQAVLTFCKSKLLLRANTSLRLHACICLIRLANIDRDASSNHLDTAREALPIMFFLLQPGNRCVAPEATFP